MGNRHVYNSVPGNWNFSSEILETYGEIDEKPLKYYAKSEFKKKYFSSYVFT